MFARMHVCVGMKEGRREQKRLRREACDSRELCSTAVSWSLAHRSQGSVEWGGEGWHGQRACTHLFSTSSRNSLFCWVCHNKQDPTLRYFTKCRSGLAFQLLSILLCFCSNPHPSHFLPLGHIPGAFLVRFLLIVHLTTSDFSFPKPPTVTSVSAPVVLKRGKFAPWNI